MPRSFDMATEYEGSVEQVHQAFCDEGYWLARLADSGADDAILDSMQVGDDGGVQVVTTQILRVDRLPALVTQFHRGDLRIHREESWSALVDGKANGTVNGAIRCDQDFPEAQRTNLNNDMIKIYPYIKMCDLSKSTWAAGTAPFGGGTPLAPNSALA